MALCGGVIFFSSDPPLSAANYASLTVFLTPTQAVQAGALWRLHGDAEWSQSGDTRTVISNTATVEFNGFPGGWSQPTNRTIQLVLFDTVTTNLEWRAPAVLSVSPTRTLDLSGFVGGPFGYTAVTLSNSALPSSCDVMFWSIAQSTNWLSLSITNGVFFVGGSTGIVAIVNSNANGFAPGSYTNTLAFTNMANGFGNTNLQVILTVHPPTTLSQPRVLTDGSFQLTLSGETGRNYSILWSRDLADWSNLMTLTNLKGTNLMGFTNWTDTQATGYSRRFYRALEQ